MALLGRTATMSDTLLTKYERVHILATRVQQLNAGATAAVPWTEGESTYQIAKRELETGRMPIRVAAAQLASSASAAESCSSSSSVAESSPSSASAVSARSSCA